MSNSKSRNGTGTTKRTAPASAVGHLFGESTRKTGLDADWHQVDPNVLLAMVWAVDMLGGSVTLGTTRSNSAYYAKVYIGAPYDPVYWDGDDEGRNAMREWVDDLVRTAAENAV